MEKLHFGEIVLLKFPFTDGQTLKRRPALVINEFSDGDIIVCRITSQIYNSMFDIYVDSWEKCGLKLPSVIRIHKVATLEKNLVELIMGKIDNQLAAKVKSKILKLTE